MKVVWIGGAFPPDQQHFKSIASRVDTLTVYGATTRMPHYTYQPQPPTSCGYRVFEPVGLVRRGPQVWLYPRLAHALSVDNPDVIHVVSEPWGVLAVQAWRWAQSRPDVAFVLHGCCRIWWHGRAPERLARRLIVRRTLRRADAFLAEIDTAVQRAREAGLSERALTGAVHTNPRDPSTFRPAKNQTERAYLRSRLGLPESGTGIGFIGRLVPEKGPMVLLGAIERLRASRNVQGWFALAGGGPLEREVRARAQRLDVRFLGELRYPDETSAFLRALDIVVIPSYTTPASEEQSPRVAIEALMCGAKVVGTTCGALPEMLGNDGVVVAENDDGALAAGLEVAIRTSENSEHRRARRLRVIGKYAGDAVAERLVAVWRRALERRPSIQ